MANVFGKKLQPIAVEVNTKTILKNIHNVQLSGGNFEQTSKKIKPNL